VRGLKGNSRIISLLFVFGCAVNSRKFEPRPGIETNMDCIGASFVFGIGEGDEDDEKMRDGDLESDFDKRRSEPD